MKALTILSLRHEPQRLPPYALETDLLCWEMCLYPVGLRALIPVRFFLQTGQMGLEALFWMCWATNLPPGVLTALILLDLVFQEQVLL